MKKNLSVENPNEGQEIDPKETERGKLAFKAALRLIAAEPNETVTVGSLKVTAAYRDGLFFLEGEKPRHYYDLGEIIVKGFEQ